MKSKRFLSIFFVLALVFFISACSNEEQMPSDAALDQSPTQSEDIVQSPEVSQPDPELSDPNLPEQTGEDDSSVSDAKTPVTSSASVSEERAGQIALAEVSGNLVDIELDYYNGVVAYEVEIESGNVSTYVFVDGNTGTVLAVEN